MNRKINIIGLTLFFTLALFSLAFSEESMTITTYYPSPYGSYNELTTTSNTYLATTSGRVGIGTVTPGTYKLYVNGSLAVNSSTADKLGTNTWGTLSDVRLKDVTGEFNYGLDKIMQLRPVRYHYKKDNPVGADYRNEYIGFVAQEVQKIIPEAVRESNQRYLVIESDAILWTMLNAIKELKIKNKALETRIKVVESKLKK